MHEVSMVKGHNKRQQWRNSSSHGRHFTYSPRRLPPQNTLGISTTCCKCGKSWHHKLSPCSVKGKSCRKCGKLNLFATTNPPQTRNSPEKSNPSHTTGTHDEGTSSSDEEYLYATDKDMSKIPMHSKCQSEQRWSGDDCGRGCFYWYSGWVHNPTDQLQWQNLCPTILQAPVCVWFNWQTENCRTVWGTHLLRQRVCHNNSCPQRKSRISS